MSFDRDIYEELQGMLNVWREELNIGQLQTIVTWMVYWEQSGIIED